MRFWIITDEFSEQPLPDEVLFSGEKKVVGRGGREKSLEIATRPRRKSNESWQVVL